MDYEKSLEQEKEYCKTQLRKEVIQAQKTLVERAKKELYNKFMEVAFDAQAVNEFIRKYAPDSNLDTIMMDIFFWIPSNNSEWEKDSFEKNGGAFRGDLVFVYNIEEDGILWVAFWDHPFLEIFGQDFDVCVDYAVSISLKDCPHFKDIMDSIDFPFVSESYGLTKADYIELFSEAPALISEVIAYYESKGLEVVDHTVQTISFKIPKNGD